RFSTLEKLRESLARTTLSWTTAAAVLICLSFFTKTSTEFSRGWAIIWFFTSLVALGGLRIFAFYRIRYWRATGRLSANVAIVGTAALAQRVMTRLEAAHESGARVVGLYGDSPET